MKISSELKRKELPDQFLEFLSFIETFKIKSGVFVSTFILLDICTLPLLYPKVNTIYIITLPLLILIHLWTIRLLIKNPYSTQFETILFIGVLGGIGTLCYFMLVLKMAYFNLGIISSSFYILLIATYFLAVLILVFYQIKKYSSLEQKKKNRKRIIKYGSVIAIAPGLGYIFAQYIMEQSQYLMELTMVICFLFFSILFAYIGAKFLYKYYFMKKNIHFVIYQQPPKKERREYQEKGIEIK